jgi:hypothetical protein
MCRSVKLYERFVFVLMLIILAIPLVWFLGGTVMYILFPGK